jgi:site-specific DNA recombinase
MKMAAIYARVSSEQQREQHTIASQTAALIAFAKTHAWEVPKEWVFEDEGYSGATLERPGLERIRDLAAEGQIQVVLVYAPDRLSRKYAYQILLIEEFARHGVETLFIKAPQGTTAEDQLLVQFQGMIAEYERAQILERSRRGKRHRARSGEISVMSGAPYGYRYQRKTDEAPAAYAVIEAEARVVERVYAMYTVDGISIGAIVRRLNEEDVPTRRRCARWERSTVWAMLRNSAYRGVACFGKTRTAARSRVTRALRLRGGVPKRNSAGHERLRDEWIEIPVPALVTEERFARAQELLQENKLRARRRTITPSLVQGLVSCQKCGYALTRTSTTTSARKIHYYKCIGSDRWRKLGGPVCDNGRFVRQDLLDDVVWTEVIRLLEDPRLIQQELDRRLAAARACDPARQREQGLARELTRVGKSVERLINAYQEELVSLEQLRERMPPLRHREQALRAELQAIADQTNDRAMFLRLAETLTAFLARLRNASDSLDVMERQRIVRLVVKDILVGEDTIVIRHCIPITLEPPPNRSPPTPTGYDGVPNSRNYLLRKGSAQSAAVEYPADGTGSGTGTPWPRLLPLCRRLQHLRQEQDGGGAGHGEHHPVSGGHAQAHGQYGQERGRASVGEDVSGLQHDVAQGPETEDCTGQPETADRQDPRRTQGRKRAQPDQSHHRTQPAPARLDELLPADRNQAGARRAGWLAPAQAALPFVATVETYCHSCAQPDEGGTDGRTRLALCVQSTRGVVEQWRKPHESGIPEVVL